MSEDATPDGEVYHGPTGIDCQECPYQDIWHPVRTPRDRCKHDIVTDHEVDYVSPSEIRKSVDADGNVIIVHDEQGQLVTDGGTEDGGIGQAPLHPSDESPQLRYCHSCVGDTLHGWDGDCWVCESCGWRWSA